MLYKYPKRYLLSSCPRNSRKEIDPQGERESLLSKIRTHSVRDLSCIVALITELEDQMGAGRGELRRQFAGNEHLSEGVINIL